MNKTIAAISSPVGEGGVSMIRLSGPQAFSIAKKVFVPINSAKDLEKMQGYTAAFGSFLKDGQKLDDGVALIFRAPHSYTGENVAELSCHGGLYITKLVLDLLLENGAELAPAGEFTKTAFLNGRLSLTEAEAVMDIISASSLPALKLAEGAKAGILFKEVKEISTDLISLAGYFGAWFDYPEEDIDEISPTELGRIFSLTSKKLKRLISSYDEGRLMREGIDTAIIGKPNVGKSTLMNRLAHFDKSIVTDIPGTTRDIVEERVRLGELILNLADTAGIRETDDLVESLGVVRAKEKADMATLVLAVFDASAPLAEEDFKILEDLKGKQVLAVLNKSDKAQDIEKTHEILNKHFKDIITISATEDESLTALEEKIKAMLSLSNIVLSDPYLANRRQLSAAKAALSAVDEALALLETSYQPDMISVLLEEAISALLELSGERASEKTVDNVFARFCVGK